MCVYIIFHNTYHLEADDLSGLFLCFFILQYKCNTVQDSSHERINICIF